MSGVLIEVEFTVTAQIELPEGQTISDFNGTVEDWECALENDIMRSGHTTGGSELAKHVKKIEVDLDSATSDPDWMEL